MGQTECVTATCKTTGNIFLVGDAWCDVSNEQNITAVRVSAVCHAVKSTANTQQPGISVYI